MSRLVRNKDKDNLALLEWNRLHDIDTISVSTLMALRGRYRQPNVGIQLAHLPFSSAPLTPWLPAREHNAI